MASSTIRYGRGVSKEVGFDLLNLGLGKKKICLMTDAKVLKLASMQTVLDSLTRAGLSYDVYSQVAVEPTDRSLKAAIEYCQNKSFDAFVAVGGGSVIDTAKAANLYMCYPQHEFLDFVNAPIGKGLPVNDFNIASLSVDLFFTDTYTDCCIDTGRPQAADCHSHHCRNRE